MKLWFWVRVYYWIVEPINNWVYWKLTQAEQSDILSSMAKSDSGYVYMKYGDSELDQ